MGNKNKNGGDGREEMTHKYNGGPAFPDSEGQADYTGGMTLRDYFAAKALQGICSSGPDRSWSDDMLACEAYRLADAMLKAREEAELRYYGITKA